jgi:hypothetical protein
VPLCTLRKWAEAETGYQGWSFDQPISFVFALQTKKCSVALYNIELVALLEFPKLGWGSGV